MVLIDISAAKGQMTGQVGIQPQAADTCCIPALEPLPDASVETDTASAGQEEDVRKGLAKYLCDLKSMLFKVPNASSRCAMRVKMSENF